MIPNIHSKMTMGNGNPTNHNSNGRMIFPSSCDLPTQRPFGRRVPQPDAACAQP